MVANRVNGRPVKGSLPFVRGGPADGGGLTNVTPNTDGDTDGLAVALSGPVGNGLAWHALLLPLACVKPSNSVVGAAVARKRSGIGGVGAGATAGLAVTVMTILSDTCGPNALAFVPNVSVAAVAVAALSMNVAIDA